jgi:hypothetical protein
MPRRFARAPADFQTRLGNRRQAAITLANVKDGNGRAVRPAALQSERPAVEAVLFSVTNKRSPPLRSAIVRVDDNEAGWGFCANTGYLAGWSHAIEAGHDRVSQFSISTSERSHGRRGSSENEQPTIGEASF